MNAAAAAALLSVALLPLRVVNHFGGGAAGSPAQDDTPPPPTPTHPFMHPSTRPSILVLLSLSLPISLLCFSSSLGSPVATPTIRSHLSVCTSAIRAAKCQPCPQAKHTHYRYALTKQQEEEKKITPGFIILAKISLY